jgi:GNAT superfamily N-acetyltransferase
MLIRIATIADIPQMQIVRNAVKENQLSDPNLVTDADCAEYITERGKGWVCEIDHQIIGFAIADLKDNNIWALFLDPNFEQKGIGQRLHNTMMEWYFSQTQKTVWLSTEHNTRAAQFYTKAGWIAVGNYGKNEIKFEMTYANWKFIKS